MANNMEDVMILPDCQNSCRENEPTNSSKNEPKAKDLLCVRKKISAQQKTLPVSDSNDTVVGKPYICELCLNSLSSESNFTLYKSMTCSGLSDTITQDPFTCKFCRKPIAQERKPCDTVKGPTYDCEVCHKSFSLRHRLKKHMRIHTGEKPYECEFCDKHFTQMANLHQHYRNRCKNSKFKCTGASLN